jgi:hypothetical protein
MFGEPEMEETSMFWLWGVPGRMFTGLVGVDMSVGRRKTNPRARDITLLYSEAANSMFGSIYT